MRIPAQAFAPLQVRGIARHHLDEADAALDQAARPQKGLAVAGADLVVDAVQRLGRQRLLAQVHGGWRGRLHAVGQVIGLHAGAQLGVGGIAGFAEGVEASEQVQRCALLLRGACGRAIEIEDGRVAGPEGDTLIHRRQETGVPVLGAGTRLPIAVIQHHVRRQVGIGRAQGIDDPGAERRPTRVQVTGIELEDGDVVRGADRHARLDERQLVGVFRKVGQQVREIRAAFAVLLEGTAGRDPQLADAALGAGLDALEEGSRHLLSRHLVQHGLVVVEVDRAGSAVLMQPDDRLHLRREMRLLRGQRIDQFGGHGRLQSEARHQAAESRATGIEARLGKEVAA